MLNAGDQRILYVKTPNDPTDAANKAYVDATHVVPSAMANAFSYLMEDTDESTSETENITIADFAASSHQIN